jgi:hypothetical protein
MKTFAVQNNEDVRETESYTLILLSWRLASKSHVTPDNGCSLYRARGTVDLDMTS